MTTPFVGEIKMVAFNFPPKGWAFCDGQLLPISQNQALFSLVGTFYGGNGTTNFALPDMRSRVPVHQAAAYPIGAGGGVENVTLQSTQMPQHTHPLNGTSGTATKRPPAGKTFAADTASQADFYTAPANLLALNPQSVTTAGSNQPHSNLQPYLAIGFCIALQGMFPSRN
ncbi:MAG: phage tail protein [Sphingomonadales bacterium]|nr:phage tail protein [Sphingomonadales bacterium]